MQKQICKKEYQITEKELFKYLDNAKNVLLIEPLKKSQYIPIGLGKIASYIKSKGGNVVFSKKAKPGQFDLICITTLFTTDSKNVLNEIKCCRQSLFLRNVPIIVGGIFASLMPEYIYKKTGVKSFVGYSKKLDQYTPDYSIDWKTEGFYKNNSIVIFTTRGCPNKCGYCMVWRMEPKFYIQKNWRDNFNINKEIAIIQDNNFLCAFLEHIEEVKELTIKKNMKVVFNNGLDIRLVNDDNAKIISQFDFLANGRPGLRFAFDRMSDDGYYQNGIETVFKYMKDNKFHSNCMTYILFNFDDTPQEAYYRAREAWRYKSFPYLMRYRPLDQLEKKDTFVGKYWTKNLVKAFKMWGEIYGYNVGDKTFESWVKNGKQKGISLTDEDWGKWNYKR